MIIPVAKRRRNGNVVRKIAFVDSCLARKFGSVIPIRMREEKKRRREEEKKKKKEKRRKVRKLNIL